MLTFDFDSGVVLAFSGTSAQTATYTTKTAVRLASTHACWIKVATNPTAAADTSGNMFIPAGTELSFVIPGGSKLAAISDGADGHLSIVPIVGVY